LPAAPRPQPQPHSSLLLRIEPDPLSELTTCAQTAARTGLLLELASDPHLETACDPLPQPVTNPHS
jgi:hypothetical protein